MLTLSSNSTVPSSLAGFLLSFFEDFEDFAIEVDKIERIEV